MKVEFLDSEMYGPNLFISAADYMKAKNNDDEYESLVHATQAFSALFDFEYEINEKEFNAVLSELDKNGAVIFAVGSSKYPEKRWMEIMVSNNNQPKKIVYEDEDGYHCVLHAKYNPKAVASIKKRHEGGNK